MFHPMPEGECFLAQLFTAGSALGVLSHFSASLVLRVRTPRFLGSHSGSSSTSYAVFHFWHLGTSCLFIYIYMEDTKTLRIVNSCLWGGDWVGRELGRDGLFLFIYFLYSLACVPYYTY